MEQFKANILSYVNQGLDLYPQNEELNKWRSKLSGPSVFEKVTENVGRFSNDRTVVSVKDINNKYERRKVKEKVADFDKITPLSSNVTTPMVFGDSP